MLDEQLKGELEVRPYIEPFSIELASLIDEAHDLQVQQEATRAQFRELIRLRQEIELRGDDLRSRIASFLRGEFGSKSEKLLRFGITPLPRTKVRKPESPPLPQPEAPAPASDEQPTE